MLTFTEKRNLQKIVTTNLSALTAGGVTFSDKRKLQKETTEALAKLGEKAVEPVINPEPTPEINPRLAALLAGNYNNMEPQAFITLVGQIVEEIKDVQAVKPGILAYVAAAKADGRITESAAQELLETARG